MTAGSSAGDFYPAHVFSGHPVAQDTAGGQYLYERALVELLAKANASGLDPARGQMIVAFLDCANEWAPNIELRLPPGAMPNAQLWYFDGPQEMTGPSGSVVAFNVEPGCYDVVGVHDGAETHRTRVSVAASVITSVFARPLTEPVDVVHTCNPDFEL